MKKRYITHFKPNKDPWNDFSATETLLSSMKLLFDWVHNTNETKGSLGGHGVTETASASGACYHRFDSRNIQMDFSSRV